MSTAPKIALLFPGQGAQKVGMGRSLYDALPEVRPLFEAASEAAGQDVVKLLFKGPLARLSETAMLQPTLTAVNMAALHVLRSRGVQPAAVAGHSLGEYSALAAAGVIEPEEAVRLTAERGRLMSEAAAKRPGVMYAVIGLPAEEVIAEVEGCVPPERGGIANINAPQQVVISGEAEALESAIKALKAKRTRAVKLNVSGAWHSELMSGIEQPFAAVLGKLELHAPKVPLFLNVTGERENDPETIRSCLERQLRNRVRWVTIQHGLQAMGITHYIEVGPGRVLRGLLRRTLSDPGAYEAFSACELQSLEQVVEALQQK